MIMDGQQEVVRLDQAMNTKTMSNEEHVIQDIHDILHAYYEVSRKTFVDSVCKQAAIHYLLHSKESPLALFCPLFVAELSFDELQDIAGEAAITKRSRVDLKTKIASLTEAMKILGPAKGRA